MGRVSFLRQQTRRCRPERDGAGDARPVDSREENARSGYREGNAAAEPADDAADKVQDQQREVSARHNIAGEDEERNGDERIFVDAVPRRLSRKAKRNIDPREEDETDPDETESDCYVDAQSDKNEEDSNGAKADHRGLLIVFSLGDRLDFVPAAKQVESDADEVGRIEDRADRQGETYDPERQIEIGFGLHAYAVEMNDA